jgi:YgiT-type zinc finger domain-containing protein
MKSEQSPTVMKTAEFKHCPICGAQDTLKMKKVKRQKIKGNQIVKAVFDMWECSKCNEGFFQHWTIDKKDIPLTDKA